MSAALVWQCVRDSNSFLRKGVNKVIFSAEPGNLYNRHSYKYSGLANAKSIDVNTDSTGAVKVGFGSVKNANQPKKYNSKYTVKSNGRRALQAIGKQTSSFRPDLKKAAVARMAAVQKSLRVKKATK